MDTKIKKHTLSKTILIVLVLGIALSIHCFQDNKRKLGAEAMKLFDRQNFAFVPKEVSNVETRAFAFLQAAIEVDNIPRMRGSIEISKDISEFSGYADYHVQVKANAGVFWGKHS